MWTDPNGTTPSIVQIDFGPWGQDMPGDGYAYCGPTSMVMGLYYLYANGFTQLAPGPFVDQDDSATVNLERIIAGLCRTSSSGGTFENGLQHGIANYLSACGLSPSQYSYTSTGNPDLAWLAEQLAPNVAASPTTIVLANFAVGWFSGTPPTLANNGGHVLAPLTVDLSGGTVTLNNAFPASFENVPNVPSKKPQTVQIQAAPPGWTLPNLSLPSQDYSQVISQTQGSGESYAILWQGQAWAIVASAAANAPNYSPSAWRIERNVALNTNGATLTVIAPIEGAGNFQKWGLGTVLLTSTNSLSGSIHVHRGILTSTVTSGTPFGTGDIILTGGGALGSVQQLHVAGTAGNVPQVTHALVAPWLVGQTNDLAQSGFFLTYATDNSPGFVPAQTVLSTSMGINAAPSKAPYQVVGPQTIDAGSTVSLAAMEVDGVTISGDSGTILQIGDQTAGSVAGLILNGGTIACGTLAFGAAEAAIYASAAKGGAFISSAITGAAGLTVFGPGMLTLRGTASGLSGPVSVNSGTLVVAGSGATGAGSVFVNSGATLEVIGSVTGAIQVAESGTLFLSGGTVEGDLNIATISETGAAPGSILQGGGILSGVATVNGMINSGPLTGLITFTNDVTIAGSATFTWTPQSLVDNSNSAPGEGWNGLVFESTQSNVGADGQYVSFYLDFTQVGSDPDGGDSFWSSGHEWTLFNFAAHGGSCWWSPQNFSYVRGNFGLKWDGWTVCLIWTPANKPQSLVERRTAEAAARVAPAGRTSRRLR
jgi:autotransporter-associated beta strand protein